MEARGITVRLQEDRKEEGRKGRRLPVTSKSSSSFLDEASAWWCSYSVSSFAASLLIKPHLSGQGGVGLPVVFIEAAFATAGVK